MGAVRGIDGRGQASGGGWQARRGDWRHRFSSHDAFSHDSIDSLGYDWGRIADPDVEPRHPWKVYLPQTTSDVVSALREAASLGERVVVRGNGHESNDLVLSDRGTVLLTTGMNAVLALDEDQLTVTAQAGAITAQLDEYLACRGYGLPVIGDHNHITVGGFASVGGMGTTGHRYGLFVDNVVELEYVTWAGEVRGCSRTENAAEFYRVLCGTGQFGVITSLTVRVLRIDKPRTILECQRKSFRDLEQFLENAHAGIIEPGDAAMVRGVWTDVLVPGGKNLAFGFVSRYRETSQTTYKQLRNRIQYGYVHRVGYLAGRMPRPIELLLRPLGAANLMRAPRYASVNNAESMLDKALDFTVGDPSRWLIAWCRIEIYQALFRRLHTMLRDYREHHRCFTFITTDLRPFRSEYLAHGSADDRFCELLFITGMNRRHMTPALFDQVVSDMDDICIEAGAYRYMHTKTVKDPDRRRAIDPNAFYALAAEPAGEASIL